MAVNDVASLAGLIFQSACKIRELGKSRYRASEEWNVKFPQKVQSLPNKIEVWKTQCARFGVSVVSDKALIQSLSSSDKALIQSLHRAKSTLEKEEGKLQKASRGCGGGCYPRVRRTLFPDKIGLYIQSVIEAFDQISEMLCEDQAARHSLQSKSMRTTPSLDIYDDNRYVALETSQEEVCRALTKPRIKGSEGPSVVLLHGAPGKGKSTLARYFAKVYFDEVENRSVFDLVTILFCGPQSGTSVGTSAKEAELLHLLGGDPDAIEDLERGQQGREWKIQKELSQLLKHRKVLLILDDVWQVELLQSIVELCGSGVTCLVTSREETLCHSLDCSSIDEIQIEDAGTEDARKLLASHLRLADHRIPEELLGIADSMIQETDNNPLAIATLASALAVKRSTALEEWEVASDNLFDSLRSENTALLLNEHYPKSFVATMHLTIENLPPQAQTLLFLTSMFKEPLVPEEIIFFLYKSPNIQGDSRTFSSFRNKLQDQQLLKVNYDLSILTDEENAKREWALHSLQQKFLTQEFHVEYMLETLVNYKQLQLAENMEDEIVNDEHHNALLVAALCALYFSESLSARAIFKLGIPYDDFIPRKYICEPLVRLLEIRASQKWSQSSKCVVQKVVLKFIRHAVLDDDALAHLLKEPTSARVALRALWEVSKNETDMYRLVDVNSMPASLTALVSFLADGVDTNIQRRAILTLHRVSNRCSFEDFPALPQLLEAIVRLLENSSCSDFQRADCAETLASLGRKNLAVCSTIVDSPGVLNSLAHSLSADDSPHLQGEAARALDVLAHGAGKSELKVINTPGVLTGLVALLSKADDPNLESRSSAEAKVSYYDKSYSKDDAPHLQFSSVEALRFLAGSTGKNKVSIVEEPGALAALLKLVAATGKDYESGRLRQAAGQTLAVLAEAEETRESVKNMVGLKETLEGLLANPTLSRVKLVRPRMEHIQSPGPRVEQVQSPGRITHEWAASILTFLDPERGADIPLDSQYALLGRAKAFIALGMYEDALADLKRFKMTGSEHGYLLKRYYRHRCIAKGKVEDYIGALVSAEKAIQHMLDFWYTPDKEDFLRDMRQRAFLKRMTGDLSGALADFNEALELFDHHSWNYEAWKQRGYVKFLMNDIEGARIDAEMALKDIPTRVEDLGYGSGALDECPIEYFGYKLP